MLLFLNGGRDRELVPQPAPAATVVSSPPSAPLVAGGSSI